MKKEVGVWIDHKKAVIVTGDGGTIEKLESIWKNVYALMEEYTEKRPPGRWFSLPKTSATGTLSNI